MYINTLYHSSPWFIDNNSQLQQALAAAQTASKKVCDFYRQSIERKLSKVLINYLCDELHQLYSLLRMLNSQPLKHEPSCVLEQQDLSEVNTDCIQIV